MEDDKKVFIIFNPNEYSEDRVRAELRDEGYPFSFTFFNKPLPISFWVDTLYDSDEVWIFGKVPTDYAILNVAKDLGKEIWQMG